MQTLTLPPMQILAETAETLSMAARDAEDRANMNALNKAMAQLHAGCTPIPSASGFLIASATRGGIVHRVSNVYGCSCEAGVKGCQCWHQSILEIIEVAQQRAVAGPTPYEEALADLMECFV